MSEIFTWKNCMADVYSYRYAPIAKDFLKLVVNPSLDTLDAQVSEWQKSDDPVALFAISDLTELIGKTRMAFCLSIQSLWEQQIRTYLFGCQQELAINPFPVSKRKSADTIHSVYWGMELNTVFEQLRGKTLPSFPSYEQLDLLQMVGNVCRHGDGNSSSKLWKKHPDLWPYHNAAKMEVAPLVAEMVIPRDMLTTFVDAICSFWEETDYIYQESIERKHPLHEASLVIKRAQRAETQRQLTDCTK